ncbi:sensor histidine kinase [Phocaeicola sartorii]|uniref:sensor histidine kinase n=1 Tax=Phocaeicola sartorii TaxID=671267 RepID=UPI00248B4934|nr:sensor histidine kinase [Phocaeicola sartorii]
MRIIDLVISFCIIGLFLASCSEEKCNVLVVHSYEEDYPGYKAYNKWVEKEFSSSSFSADIRYFYLDCENFNEPGEIKAMNKLLDSCTDWKPDVILVNDDQATYALLKTHHPLLKETPTIFAGVNYPNWGLIKQYSNLTGFHDKIDLKKNLRMIERVTGQRNIYTVLDYTFIDRKIREDACEQLVTDSVIDNLDWRFNWETVVEECEKGNIVFSGYSVRNPSKQWNKSSKHERDFIWAVSKYGNRPYLQVKFDYVTVTIASSSTRFRFTAINELFDCGFSFLGGYITPMPVQVEEQVKTAVRVLEGEDISRIPIRESAKGYFMDWNVMHREGMELKDMPKEYTVINVPFKVRSPFLWWFFWVGGTLLVSCLLAFVTYLYWRETQRKRNVLYALEDEKESLALAVAGSDSYAWRLKKEKMIFDTVFGDKNALKPHSMDVSVFCSFIHPSFLPQVESILHRDMIDGKRFVELQCDFDGKGYQWWELRCSTMKSIFGEQKTTGLLLNIEEYKKREQELIEAREVAEKAELKESFLANMSHEIRTPLNAIVGFSNLLASPDMEFSDEEKKQFIDTITRNNELLLKLINDILEISRIESGYFSFNNEDWPLASVVDEIYQTHSLLMPRTLEFSLEKGDGTVWVHLDRDRLVQVITNFLNNAAKFTTKGYIKLGWNYVEERHEVELYVEDTGIGISKSEQKVIFSRFYKKDEFVQGTGLGLFICKVIVEKLGGRIALSSEVGVGSRFSVFFSAEKRDF